MRGQTFFSMKGLQVSITKVISLFIEKQAIIELTVGLYIYCIHKNANYRQACFDDRLCRNNAV